MGVTVEQREHVLLIGLDRPEQRNAINEALLKDLAAAYGRLEDDAPASACSSPTATISPPGSTSRRSQAGSPPTTRLRRRRRDRPVEPRRPAAVQAVGRCGPGLVPHSRDRTAPRRGHPHRVGQHAVRANGGKAWHLPVRQHHDPLPT